MYVQLKFYVAKWQNIHVYSNVLSLRSVTKWEAEQDSGVKQFEHTLANFTKTSCENSAKRSTLEGACAVRGSGT